MPLMSMIRAHEASENPSLFRLLYSLKSPKAEFYREELRTLSQESPKLTVDYVYTRKVPQGAGQLLRNGSRQKPC